MQPTHRRVRRLVSLLAAMVLVVLCGSSPPASAQGHGAIVLHLSGDEVFFITTNADDTLGALWTFQVNAGNFIREEVNGTFWIHLHTNNATVEVCTLTSPKDCPTGAGSGALQLSSTADVTLFPDGSFTFTLTPESIILQGTGDLTDLSSGEACSLAVRQLVRQEQTKQFAFVLKCD